MFEVIIGDICYNGGFFFEGGFEKLEVAGKRVLVSLVASRSSLGLSLPGFDLSGHDAILIRYPNLLRQA